jgi:hypothetical protein
MANRLFGCRYGRMKIFLLRITEMLTEATDVPASYIHGSKTKSYEFSKGTFVEHKLPGVNLGSGEGHKMLPKA